MGVVYHAHYLNFFEHARTEMLRERGLTYRELEEGGVMMPVVDVAVQFRRPAFYDDLLTIHVRVHEPPSSRIKLTYEVRRAGEDQVLVTGHVTLCFIDSARRRPVPAPEQMRLLFADSIDLPDYADE
jgi:acyl-CoA thioester hydrolase